MSKFLYGAAVQGIQSFIFQTNTLKEIIGASELVEDICTSLFAKQLAMTTEELENDNNCIIAAAGNIKYIFDDKEACKQVFREFPKTVLLKAPEITISQAAVEFNEGDKLSDAIQKLEKKLRAKRNQPLPPLTTGLMGMQRSRATGTPERYHNDNTFCDENTWQKLKAINKIALWKKATGLDSDDVSALSGKPTDNIGYFTGDNDWVAIIHADGNGLGKIVSVIGRNLKSVGNSNDFHEFSSLLDKSTCEAARQAFGIVLKNHYEDSGKHIPFRPIVLGGDDLTVIIRGDLAINYTRTYLESFEENTRKNFKGLADKYEGLKNGLTACAGIAFIKSSFPYYYGYDLAEELCGEAKKASGREHSCLMFHKVQDSYVSSYNDIVKRELTTPEGNSFKFGPYSVHENAISDFWNIGKLTSTLNKLEGDNGNALKSDIRQWLSAMMQPNGSAKAEQLLNRLENINPDKETIRLLTEKTTRKSINCYPAYDALSLHSIYYQKTK